MTLLAKFADNRRSAVLLATMLALLIAVAALLVGRSQSAQATVVLPPANASQLIKATSGEQLVEIRATGMKAELINASLPFSTSPIQAARPFDIADNSLDQRRALLCMTQAVYYEAAYEPIDGRRAVAQVVLNRLRHPAFPKSVCGVVYQGSTSPVCQFSFVCDGSLYRAPAMGAWKEAEQVARAALNGYVERSVGAATHYHADYVAPTWAPLLAKISKIGVHIFYRWPGQWGSTAAFTGRYIGEPLDPVTLRPPLRKAVATTETTEEAVVAAPAFEGPPIPRATNDVGGLLDTSKGWTLNMQLPSDLKAKAGAQAPVPAAPVASDGTVATIASR